MIPVSLALLVAGLLFTGCQDGVAEVGGPASLQTTEALDILPGNAQMVGMVDLAAARASGSVGQMMKGEMSPFGQNGSGEMERIIRLTGFDPAEDIDRVYVAAASDNESAALVLYARFDRDRIERVIADEAPEDLERTEIEGVPAWIAAENDGDRFAFALPNDKMMVAGSEAAVRAMLSRISTGASGASADAELMALVEKARHREGAWAIVRDIDGAQMNAPGDDAMGQLGGLTDAMVTSFDFADTGFALDAYVVPRSGAAASDVADVARAAVSTMRIQAKDEPALMQALDDVEVREEGEGVRVTAFMPESLMTQARASR
ncbi:MAG: hypothetical protein AAGI52_04955 [Bacteroidota bacterium]